MIDLVAEFQKRSRACQRMPVSGLRQRCGIPTSTRMAVHSGRVAFSFRTKRQTISAGGTDYRETMAFSGLCSDVFQTFLGSAACTRSPFAVLLLSALNCGADASLQAPCFMGQVCISILHPPGTDRFNDQAGSSDIATHTHTHPLLVLLSKGGVASVSRDRRPDDSVSKSAPASGVGQVCSR